LKSTLTSYLIGPRGTNGALIKSKTYPTKFAVTVSISFWILVESNYRVNGLVVNPVFIIELAVYDIVKVGLLNVIGQNKGLLTDVSSQFPTKIFKVGLPI